MHVPKRPSARPVQIAPRVDEPVWEVQPRRRVNTPKHDRRRVRPRPCPRIAVPTSNPAPTNGSVWHIMVAKYPLLVAASLWPNMRMEDMGNVTTWENIETRIRDLGHHDDFVAHVMLPLQTTPLYTLDDPLLHAVDIIATFRDSVMMDTLRV